MVMIMVITKVVMMAREGFWLGERLMPHWRGTRPSPQGRWFTWGNPPLSLALEQKIQKILICPLCNALEVMCTHLYYPVRTVCKQYAVQTSALGLFMKPHIHPGAALCSP